MGLDSPANTWCSATSLFTVNWLSFRGDLIPETWCWIDVGAVADVESRNLKAEVEKVMMTCE